MVHYFADQEVAALKRLTLLVRQVTQEQYDALNGVYEPGVMYVIVG